ncbi:Protein of unknown function [Clostridium cavendishii DSM 21758]|uniref:DUF2812 domain-containing protein n=1 Tax=Clostridium cavendishii DSM 21758 TaxID=1121302 RepID=A0A1M6QXG6_9CLOT|nr:DUF2812 domain-containing protein [Clostridium cavendishii]SHK24813.1 Protein of unknown function [Clostridium cavendishii DSM 21758]
MRLVNTKIKLCMFLPYQCTALEEYLEGMASKGWLLKSIKNNYYIFKKCEPKKLKYSIDFFDKLSIFDKKNSRVALEYREYCEVAGWRYVCESGKLQVFCSDKNKEPIAIQTDETEKFKVVRKTSIYALGFQLINVLLFIFILLMQWIFQVPEFILTNNIGIFSSLVMFIFILINLTTIIHFIIWSIMAKRKLKTNNKLIYSNYKQLIIKNIFQKAYCIISLVGLIWFCIIEDSNMSGGLSIGFIIGIALCILVDMLAQRWIDKKNYSRETNIFIRIGGMALATIVMIMIINVSVIHSVFSGAYNNQQEAKAKNPSLTLMDFGFNKNDKDEYKRYNKSILASRELYWLNNGVYSLDTTIFESKYGVITRFYGDRLVEWLNSIRFDYKLQESKLPKNIKVYYCNDKKNNEDRFVLVSDNKVVELRKGFDTISNDEFLNKVYEKVLK